MYIGGGEREAVGRVERVKLERKLGGLEVCDAGCSRAACGREGRWTEVGERTWIRVGSS